MSREAKFQHLEFCLSVLMITDNECLDTKVLIDSGKAILNTENAMSRDFDDWLKAYYQIKREQLLFKG